MGSKLELYDAIGWYTEQKNKTLCEVISETKQQNQEVWWACELCDLIWIFLRPQFYFSKMELIELFQEPSGYYVR